MKIQNRNIEDLIRIGFDKEDAEYISNGDLCYLDDDNIMQEEIENTDEEEKLFDNEEDCFIDTSIPIE